MTAERVSETFTNELAKYHEVYAPLFARVEQREQAEKYLKNLMGKTRNKSVETMILETEGAKGNVIRNQQRFLSNSPWDDVAILKRHWMEVNQDLGETEGVLIVDGSDFPKEGDESVGVKRQWCGELGKIANCQAGVFLGYASSKGHTLLDRRLYLPEEWLAEKAFADRLIKCGVPKDVEFKTKPQLATEMIKAVTNSGNLRFTWLTCDEAFGRDTVFLDSVVDSVRYFAEVPLDTRAWLTQPKVAVPPYSGQGRRPTIKRLVPGQPEAETVTQIAASLPQSQWIVRSVKEGTKGTIRARFAALRVVTVRDGLPGPDQWLVFRRNLYTGELKAFVSNAPVDTSITTFARISGIRWPIESTFEECKQELGLGDYQVRGWRGWHHHMTLCILAHFFLVRLRLKLGNDAPSFTLPQTVTLLQAVFPQPQFSVTSALQVVQYQQKRQHAAYLSHRKKRARRPLPVLPDQSL